MFSNGSYGNVEFYINDRFEFYNGVTGTRPPVGATFTQTTNTKVLFRKRVRLDIEGDITFDLDIDKSSDEQNNTGNHGIVIIGTQYSEIKSLKFSRFGGCCLNFIEGYRGLITGSKFYGNGRQGYKFYSNGMSLGGCYATEISHNEGYSYGQWINLGGFANNSQHIHVHHNFYRGGGFFFNEQGVYPEEGWDNTDQEKEWGGSGQPFTSSLMTSHGGSDFGVYENNTAVNAYSPFGALRSRQEVSRNNTCYGAVYHIYYLQHNAGCTIENNNYYYTQSSSDILDTSAQNHIPICFVDLSAQAWGTTTTLPQRYPLIIRNNYADMVGNGFVRVFHVDDNSNLRNIIVKDNVLNKFAGPDRTEGSTFTNAAFFVVPSGSYNFERLILDGNEILDMEINIEKYVRFNGLYDPIRVRPIPSSYIRIGNNNFHIMPQPNISMSIPIYMIPSQMLNIDLSRISNNDVPNAVSLNVRGNGSGGTFTVGATNSVVVLNEAPNSTNTENGKIYIYYTFSTASDFIPRVIIYNTIDVTTPFRLTIS